MLGGVNWPTEKGCSSGMDLAALTLRVRLSVPQVVGSSYMYPALGILKQGLRIAPPEGELKSSITMI